VSKGRRGKKTDKNMKRRMGEERERQRRVNMSIPTKNDDAKRAVKEKNKEGGKGKALTYRQ